MTFPSSASQFKPGMEGSPRTLYPKSGAARLPNPTGPIGNQKEGMHNHEG